MFDVAVIALLAWLAGAAQPDLGRTAQEIEKENEVVPTALGMIALSVLICGAWIAVSFFTAAHGHALPGDFDMRPEMVARRMLHLP